MRVILVTHGKVNPKGHNGISRVVYNLNKYEKKYGIQSEIWSVVDGIKKEELYERDECVSVRCFPRIKSIFSTKNELCKKIEKEKDSIDLVHFHMPWLPDKLAVAKMCKNCNIPYIVTGHSAYSSSQKQSWKMKLGKKYELPFLNGAAAVHAITREESTEFRKFGINTNIFVIPNSIEDVLTSADSKKESDVVRFLFIGELRNQKNIDGLIKSVSILEENIKNKVKFTLVGPDSNGNMEKLKQLAKDLGVSHQFEFTGGVFGDERSKYFETADIYITPSLSEVISLSAIEAMAYGLPGLFTRQSDVSYFYNQNSFVMCENDYHDISRGIKEIIDRKDDWKQMGINARKTYENNFKWEINTQRFIENYTQVIEDNKKRGSR